VAFSPDGKTLASGSLDGTVRFWNVASHRLLGPPLRASRSFLESVAFSPDGKTLATGTPGDTALLWDVATRRQLGEPLTGQPGGPGKPPALLSPPDVTAVAFSSDGKTLATSGDDHAVRLWDVTSHRQLGTPLIGHTDVVDSVAFSPDGKTLATGSADHTARLWDVATHQQIGVPLSGHTDAVDAVAFSPDGKTLATSSADHTVRLWDVSYLVDTARELCASTARSFTRAEWRKYIPPGPPYRRLCP
jgi:hypothetical protein